MTGPLTTLAFVEDPEIAGWVIFMSYFGGAVLCVRALSLSLVGGRIAARYGGTERRAADRTMAYRASVVFWGLLVALLVLLGVNKHLDMQTWLTRFGRRVAEAQGWYEHRGRVQTLFVLLVAVSGVGALAVLLRLTRDLLPRHVLAFFGIILLAMFLVLRASSFHDLDETLAIRLLGFRVSWLLELGGIACIGACAAMNSRWHGTRSREFLRRWRERRAVRSP